MSLSGVFDIAGMGMSAQSIRLNTTASNLANAQAAGKSEDETYRARHPVFSSVAKDLLNPGSGPIASLSDQASVGLQVVDIVESTDPLQQRYEPNHPNANDDGYVFYPNVNVVEEMADMISASRSFQVNVEVMNSAKTMMQRLLTLGQ
ncbi:MAG: flagellar basal-body rod protein FlgC [Paraglaciecola psychrophila]|jgi:flagellar basal-body rod protein FlgC